MEGLKAQTLVAAISTDGSLIACGGDDLVLRIFDVSGCLLVAADSHRVPIYSLAFSPDGSRVASAGPQRLAYPNHPLLGFVADPHGEVPIVVADPPGGVPLSKPIFSLFGLGLPHAGLGDRPPITSTGRGRQELLLLTERGVVILWDVKTGRPLHTWGDYDNAIDTVAFSKSGFLLTTFDDHFGLRLRNATTGLPWLSLTQDGMTRQDRKALSVVTSLSSTTTRLVSVAAEEDQHIASIKLWDAAGSRFRVLNPDASVATPLAVSMSPDGKHFATSCSSESLDIWDFAKGVVIRTLTAHATEKRVTLFLAHSPDGERILSSDHEGVVRVWDLDSGRLLQTREGPGGPVRAVAFLPSGIRVVSGGFDHQYGANVPKEKKGNVQPLVVWDLGFE